MPRATIMRHLPPTSEVPMYASRIVPLLLLFAACAPRQVHQEPVIRQGERLPDAEATIEAARAETERGAAASQDRRDDVTARALATCAPEICEAITRGEVMLGMSETQVLAATRTTDAAWSTRAAGGASVMVPTAAGSAPRDAVGELAMVQLRDGRVRTYSYHEAQGVRVVADAADATTDGRAQSLAEVLLREGDEFAARGDLERALDRYDRASILTPADARIDYRIATTLDKQLRPIEALIRYQLFLHRLELEKIDAYGRAYGNLADAIAHARERVIVLEKR
jgi:tetratricopeptide (TPR) repeat protein